jgi:DNA-binding XRE family transcriptional regulator
MIGSIVEMPLTKTRKRTVGSAGIAATKATTIVGKYSPVARDSNHDGSQNGRAASGMYPQVSRTKLAQACGKDVTTISQIMRGRIRPKFEVALAVARAVGVDPEQFEVDWQRQRAKFEREEGEKYGGQ